MAFVILFSTVISSSYAQDTFRDYGNYQYFDAINLDGSGQKEDSDFNDIRPGRDNQAYSQIHPLYYHFLHSDFMNNKNLQIF